MNRRGGRARAATAVVVMVAMVGCSQTVSGTVRRSAQGVPDQDRSYGFVNDSCGLLTDDTVQQTLGAQSVVRPYSGAVCQYVLARESGLTDVVFSWFDSGSLVRERALATERRAQITDVEVERHPAFLATSDGDAAACSATAAAGSGVVSWWVQYRPQGGDPCQAAQKLLAATLSSNM